MSFVPISSVESIKKRPVMTQLDKHKTVFRPNRSFPKKAIYWKK